MLNCIDQILLLRMYDFRWKWQRIESSDLRMVLQRKLGIT